MANEDTFKFRARGDGGMEFTDYNRARFVTFLKKNPGRWMSIKPERVESSRQRKFFEGAVVPLVTFYQEGMDYHSGEDIARVREWLKIEFNGEIVMVKDKSIRIAKTTSAGALHDFLERVIAWMDENGYQTQLLDPESYKYWKDVLYPNGGAENYIDYLIECGKLKKVYDDDWSSAPKKTRSSKGK